MDLLHHKKILLSMEIPASSLDELDGHVDMHFVIATELLKNKEYFGWYRQYLQRPVRKPVMLDNGMYEEGQPLSPKELLDLTLELEPDIVFAPDQHPSKEETLKLSVEFFKLAFKAWDEYEQNGAEFRTRLGFIPQGRTPEEVVDCYWEFVVEEMWTPAVIGWSFLNDRVGVLEEIEKRNLYMGDGWHHFLGLYSVEEIRHWPAWVDSMDTVKPIKAAYLGHKLERMPRGTGKWSSKWDVVPSSLLYRNISLLHQKLTRRIYAD